MHAKWVQSVTLLYIKLVLGFRYMSGDTRINSIIEKVKDLGAAVIMAEDYEEIRQFGETGQIDNSIKFEPLESQTIEEVSISNESLELEHFVDGVQRSLSIAKVFIKDYGFFPAFCVQIASAIIERVNRRLSVWGPDDDIFVAKTIIGVLPDGSISEPDFRDGIWYYPCKTPGPYLAKICDKVRGKMERECVDSWTKHHDYPAYILVDGGVFQLGDRNVVGLIKNINSTYIPAEEFRWLTKNLKPGHRSQCFAIKSAKNIVVSCFLRMHDGDDLTGIVRLEMPMLKGLPISKVIENLNTLAAHIGEESDPTIFPAKRWDRQIYPVQACEEFLRTQLLSISMLRATIEGII